MAFTVNMSPWRQAQTVKDSRENVFANLNFGRQQRGADMDQKRKIGGITQLMGLLNLGGGGEGGGLSQPGGPDNALGLPGGFGNIMTTRQGQLQDLLGTIANAGQGRRQRINEQFGSAKNTELARLEGRGLGSSNLGAAAVGAIEGQKGLALGDLDDSLIQQKLGVKQKGFEGITKAQEDAIAWQQQQQQMQNDLFKSLLGTL